MIVEYAEILNDLDRSHSQEIQKDHEAVEAWIKAATGHDWESTSYVEFCTANGTMLELDHYPVSQITEIAPRAAGIKIKNTSTDSRNAYVNIDSDSLDLTVVGGTNAMTASEAFSSYTTLSALVTQINAEGYGWSAEIYDTDYNDYPSASLMEVNNFFCGASRGVAPAYRNLEILDTPYSDYDCDEETGLVYRSGGWASGYRQIIAKYSAYASGQADIQEAVRQAVKHLVIQREESTEGIKSYSTGDLSVTFDSIMPASVLNTVALHSKVI